MDPPKRIKLDLKEVIKRGYQIEQNVGITEFVGKHQLFIGVLKDRFEDFIVHEIDKNGNVINLENIDKPEDIFSTIEEQYGKKNSIQIESLKIDPNFKDIIDKYVESNFESENPLLSIDEFDKQKRTEFHLYVKQNYSGLESRTETLNGKKFIRIVPMKQLNNRNKRNPKWPTNKPSYVHFVLYKENLETVQVVNEISRRLGSTTKNFTFAGSKDKRAITTQRFSAFRTHPLEIWRVVQDFNQRSRNQTMIHVGHFQFNPQPLRLGDLSGNKFEIILRNVRLVEDLDRTSSKTTATSNNTLRDVCGQALADVKNHGFINYYGMQRFGSHRIDSHKLGILILRKEFKKLVEEILVEKPIDCCSQPYQHQREVLFNEAIRLWKETGDAALAYKKINYKYTIEGSLLRALAKVDPNDFHGALCIGMNRSSRLLYLHAYQSYLWNQIASFRIREYGLNVVEGDLVFVGQDLEPYHEEHNEDDNDKSSPNTTNNIKANIPSDQIILVTAKNLDQFTIFDVVLPIIGGLSKFPQNRTKEFIDKLMQEESVSVEQFASLGKQWCVNGSYRKLLVKPSDFKWEWMEYMDDNKPLILSDLDRIKRKTLKQKLEEQLGNMRKQALKIEVRLPTSSYATIFLREITKISSMTLENKPWSFS